jgi:hypothetical protein
MDKLNSLEKGGNERELLATKMMTRINEKRAEYNNNMPKESPELNAENIKAATEYAKSIGLNADYAGLDGKTAFTINEEISKAYNDFPELKTQLKFVGTDLGKFKDSANAVFNPITGYIGVKGGFDEQAYKSNITSQFHPEGTNSIKAVIDHEVGHAIMDSYRNVYGQTLILNNGKIRDTYYTARDKGKDYIKTNLSGYANVSDSEFIAEAWSEYKNNPNPREIATTVGKLLENFKGK